MVNKKSWEKNRIGFVCIQNHETHVNTHSCWCCVATYESTLPGKMHLYVKKYLQSQHLPIIICYGVQSFKVDKVNMLILMRCIVLCVHCWYILIVYYDHSTIIVCTFCNSLAFRVWPHEAGRLYMLGIGDDCGRWDYQVNDDSATQWCSHRCSVNGQRKGLGA